MDVKNAELIVLSKASKISSINICDKKNIYLQIKFYDSCNLQNNTIFKNSIHLFGKDNLSYYLSLQQLIKEEIKAEWFCPKCQYKQTVIKTKEINILPNILIIHLNIVGTIITNKSIDYPLNDLEIEKEKYDLIAIANNDRCDRNYTAYTKSDNKWSKFDGLHVDELNEEDVIYNKNAYVLFYQRQNINDNN